MEEKTVTPRCVALTAAENVRPREAAELVREAMARRGIPSWRSMEVELFPSRGCSLIVAHPARDGVVHIQWADWLSGLM